MHLRFPLWSKVATLALALVVLAACVPRLNRVSARHPDLFEKESSRLAGQGRDIGAAHAPEIYVRRSQPVIRKVERSNDTGSLFNPDDERNHLFTTSWPQAVGRFLAINVAMNRVPSSMPGTPANTPSGPAMPSDPDAIEAELLKALPELEPAKPGEPALLKSFKMRIAHRFENGDVLARLSRRSSAEEDAAVVTVSARIPHDRLVAGDPLTTDDLLDVSFVENTDGEMIERNSSGWEDEYTLRLSGFNEAKSKMALALDDRRKELQEARDKLETRIKAFGAERQQVAKQRDDLGKARAESEAKIKDMNDKLAEQQKTIEDQRQEIESLKPENKPGDDKGSDSEK